MLLGLAGTGALYKLRPDLLGALDPGAVRAAAHTDR
jgi:hypothetical protein